MMGDIAVGIRPKSVSRSGTARWRERSFPCSRRKWAPTSTR